MKNTDYYDILIVWNWKLLHGEITTCENYDMGKLWHGKIMTWENNDIVLDYYIYKIFLI